MDDDAAAAAKRRFLRASPDYGYADARAVREAGGFDAWHDREFPSLLTCGDGGGGAQPAESGGMVYADHAGATLPARSQVAASRTRVRSATRACRRLVLAGSSSESPVVARSPPLSRRCCSPPSPPPRACVNVTHLTWRNLPRCSSRLRCAR